MEGTLSPRCEKCHTHVKWEKIHFIRDDLYPDWTLAVFCECGMVTDPEIRKAARADYDQKNADAIYAEQEANLKKFCPKWAQEAKEAESMQKQKKHRAKSRE